MKQEQEKPELTDLQKADCLTGKALGGIAFRALGWGAGKRRRFVFEDRDCFYHTMSRVAGGELLFGDILTEVPGKKVFSQAFLKFSQNLRTGPQKMQSCSRLSTPLSHPPKGELSYEN